MACEPLIRDPFDFPHRAHNRPGLPRVAYRIGRYADFLEAMTRSIDAAPELAGWTHREPDDPAIALLQGPAILGDILAFYQEHYANEAWLRTAAWRESVAELVRLTGYRLAPGIGGRATLAFEARGTAPVLIRKGFPVKLDLKDGLSADFALDAELLAWPHLGRFHLYRPRSYAGTLAAGATALELAAVDGASDPASLAAFALKAGERLLLQPPEPAWTTSAAPFAPGPAPQLVKVTKVTRLLGRVILELDAPLQRAWTGPVSAWRVNRSFRHAGHNAPPVTVTSIIDGSGKITGSRQRDTAYERHLIRGHDCASTEATINLGPALVPLDQDVADLLPGSRVVVQAEVHAGGAPLALSLTRRVASVETRTIGFGNLTVASSLLTLDPPLVSGIRADAPLSDVRSWRILEITSPPLALQPLPEPPATAFPAGAARLDFYGTAQEASALAGRRLWLEGRDAAALELVCNNTEADFVLAAPDLARMWPLRLDRRLDRFAPADFDEAAPQVVVHANLADASQGKAERETVLGNGDGREAWQTFPLPKAPLTWLAAPGATPPYAPELQVWVDARLWTRVDAFYGHGPLETIYIVREDSEGRSFIQFGDGETGARLPSGLRNVTAGWRSSSGARGPLAPGATPAAGERPPGFDKVALMGIVTGGADPEDGTRARLAAPAKVQSLGRLVSIADYESEALTVPGVVAASASWDLYAGVPALVLRVLLAAGREAEFAAVRTALNHAQRCRGPDRFPLVVEQARLRYAFADIGFAPDPSYRQQDIEAAIRAALGLAGAQPDEPAGLFGLHARRLGEPEYASRIEGRLQNVAGVLWCKVSALGLLPAGVTDPATAPLPAAPRAQAALLPCAARELLQLAPQHLTLAALAAPSAGECA
jgi:predicted phage baseplate assembly protein